jgi:hypothetical protein
LNVVGISLNVDEINLNVFGTNLNVVGISLYVDETNLNVVGNKFIC